MRHTTRVYIDGANLHKGTKAHGWDIDYLRFFVWLRDRYRTTDCVIYFGRLASNEKLYFTLKKYGYILAFKEVAYDAHGTIKGNCDSELVVDAVRDVFEKGITRAVLVSADGDFSPLIRFWKEKSVVTEVVSPSAHISHLLVKENVPIVQLNSQRHLLARDMKKPSKGT